MSERLKRRKKQPEKTGTEAAPAPLQPAFYDVEPRSQETPAESNDALPAQVQEEPQHSAAAEPHEQKERPASSEAIASGDVNRRRRRRSRGGRGRKRGGSPGESVGGEQLRPAEGAAPTVPVHPSRQSSAPPKPVSLQASKGVVVLAIGLPGSGKSSWFKRNSITPLSSDLLRALLFDDPTEQRFQDLIFSNLRSMLKARLIARRPMNYVDATNLSAHERQGWIKLGKDYGYEVQAVFFDVPLEVCLQRNERRDRKVPEDAMRRMASKLKPPTFEEGFSKITVVRVKQKE